MARQYSVSLGRFSFFLRISRRAGLRQSKFRDDINLGYARALERHFPQLRDFGFILTPENAVAVGEFYADYLPMIREESRGAHLRSLLDRLRSKTKDPAVRCSATIAIAVSDLADGEPDRATILKDHPLLAKEWQTQTARLEAAYGAALVTQDWGKSGRAESLILYFEAHPELLQGKKVLHFAPEDKLRAWLEANKSVMGIARYRTADGYNSNVDENHDITALKIADSSFDVVICHRVMEHVLDDNRGFAELFRVLRPGGLLSFSVPQAPHQAATVEWAIPDESHHGHVRHYGADLEDRMRGAGFDVQIEPWLLQRQMAELKAHNAYPMRIFNAWRRA